MGPAVCILLKEDWDKEKRAMLKLYLQKHTSISDDLQVWISNFTLANKTYKGDNGCALYIGVSKSPEILSYENCDEIAVQLTFTPKSEISIGAGCNSPLDHKKVGFLAVGIANLFDGIIELDGSALFEQKALEICVKDNGVEYKMHFVDADSLEKCFQNDSFKLIK